MSKIMTALIQQIQQLEDTAEDFKLIKNFLWNEATVDDEDCTLTNLGVEFVKACVQRKIPTERAARILGCSKRDFEYYVEKYTKN